MEIVRLYNDDTYINDVHKFFIRNNFSYFNPHRNKSIEQSFQEMVKDSYYGVYHNGALIAYGMLRGMDEGYEIPMLGIAVDIGFQSLGIGKMLMSFLEITALLCGYKEMKLRVYYRNTTAREMYHKLKYRELSLNDDGYITMVKSL